MPSTTLIRAQRQLLIQTRQASLPAIANQLPDIELLLDGFDGAIEHVESPSTLLSDLQSQASTSTSANRPRLSVSSGSDFSITSSDEMAEFRVLSINTTAKFPTMEGKTVRAYVHDKHPNGKRADYTKEERAYQNSPLSISSTVVAAHNYADVNGWDDKGRYLQQETFPFTKRPISAARRARRAARNPSAINDNEWLDVIEFGAIDSPAPSPAPAPVDARSPALQVEIIDSSNDDNDSMALDHASRATPFDTNLPTLHAFGGQQAFSERFMNISETATIDASHYHAQHDITQPRIQPQQLGYHGTQLAITGSKTTSAMTTHPGQNDANMITSGEGSDTDADDDDEEMADVWEDVL